MHTPGRAVTVCKTVGFVGRASYRQKLGVEACPLPVRTEEQERIVTVSHGQRASRPASDLSLPKTSSGVLVLVDDASGPVASPDPEGLEVGYPGWKRLERCGAG
jgi:hypothetical protein